MVKAASKILLFTAPLAILLSACEANEADNGPGGLSPSDAKAMDAAAAKLDEQQTKPEKEN